LPCETGAAALFGDCTLDGTLTLSTTWIVHLSLVIKHSALFGEPEEHWAEVDEVPWTGKRESWQEARGNSAILSIRGALTETSGESMPRRRPTLALYGVVMHMVLVGSGREALRDGGVNLTPGVEDAGSWNHNKQTNKLTRAKLYDMIQMLIQVEKGRTWTY